MKKASKMYTAALIIALMALVLSAAIAVPLVWRGFYYLHIDALGLPEKTGWTAFEIREAFDEMMDYCVFGEPFGTGVLKWSQEGYAHFADCAVLFRMDFTALAISLAGVLLLLHIGKDYTALPILGRGPMFWAGSLLSGGFAVIAGLAALDFDRAFVIFHSLFFPGKTNWIFDYRVDEIIEVLPQVVFRNYAILIVGLLFAGCLLLIATDFKCNQK
ncbi:MAG: TIGR01906 family membrane protein [Oscillospiraceae bacterium]|nr:TIGR01906 family membrane protein [Oscillospiraceae bacterium]